MKLKNKKKVFAITMIISMIMSVLSLTIDVHATYVTFEGTLGDVLYNYTSDDLLSIPNYMDYFTVPNDKLYLKYDAQYQRLTNNSTTEFGYDFWNNIKMYWDSGISTGLKEISFPDHNGYKLFYWWYTGTKYTCQTLVIDTQGIPVLINGRVACTEQFNLYYNQYSVSTDFTSYNLYPDQSSYSGVVSGSQSGNYYYFNLDLNRQCMYSEIPYLMSYYNDSLYPDGQFLSQDPYYYDNFVNVLDAYYNNSDDTGFVIDRRTTKMINGGEDPQPQDTLGVLSGSFKHLFTGISQDKCDLFISYELNDYTKSLRDRVKLVLDYEVNIEGSYSGNSIHFSNSFSDSTGNLDYYNVFNSNILQIDMDNVFSKIMSDPLSDTIPDSFIPAEYYGIQAATLYHSYSALNYFDFMLSQGGFGITQSFNHESSLMEDLFSGNYTVDGSTANRNWVIPSQSTLGYVFGSSYDYYTTNNNAVLTTCNFVVTEYLLDSNGNRSNTNTYMYDLLTGNYQVVGGFETDGDTTFTKYNGQNYATNPVPYNSTAGGYSIVGGNPMAYGGSSTASIGDININVGAGGTAGQLLVDMPADEWLQHSPNFNNLITTLKTGITSVSTDSESVAVMLKDTYAIFPIEVWGYLALAICTISSLAVIRYIRRG